MKHQMRKASAMFRTLPRRHSIVSGPLRSWSQVKIATKIRLPVARSESYAEPLDSLYAGETHAG